LAFSYCFHLLRGQRFSAEHLGSFLAGTEDWRRREEYFLGVKFEDIRNLRSAQHGGGAKAGYSLNNCQNEGEDRS
jgi:hypothetical protein